MARDLRCWVRLRISRGRSRRTECGCIGPLGNLDNQRIIQAIACIVLCEAAAQATGLNTDNSVSLSIETIVPTKYGLCYGDSLQIVNLPCLGPLYKIAQQYAEFGSALKTWVGENSLQLLFNFAVALSLHCEGHLGSLNLDPLSYWCVAKKHS